MIPEIELIEKKTKDIVASIEKNLEPELMLDQYQSLSEMQLLRADLAQLKINEYSQEYNQEVATLKQDIENYDYQNKVVTAIGNYGKTIGYLYGLIESYNYYEKQVSNYGGPQETALKQKYQVKLPDNVVEDNERVDQLAVFCTSQTDRLTNYTEIVNIRKNQMTELKELIERLFDRMKKEDNLHDYWDIVTYLSQIAGYRDYLKEDCKLYEQKLAILLEKEKGASNQS